MHKQEKEGKICRLITPFYYRKEINVCFTDMMSINLGKRIGNKEYEDMAFS